MKPVVLALCVAGIAHAQSPVHQRTLGAPITVSTDTFANIAAVRELGDGRLLVVEPGPVDPMVRNMMLATVRAMARSDSTNRNQARIADSAASKMFPQSAETRTARVVLLDKQLGNGTLVGHTGTGQNAYGHPVTLIAARADTTLLVDQDRSELLIINPSGTISGLSTSVGNTGGVLIGAGAAVDRFGRVLYVGRTTVQRPGPNGMQIITPDTTPIVAFDPASGATATVAQAHIAGNTATMMQNAADPGMMSMSTKATPFPVLDDWVSMFDGSLAIIRGADLHIDWIGPNGTHRSTPPIPHVRKEVSDSDLVLYRRGHPRSLDSMPMMPRGMSVTQLEPDSFPKFKPPFSSRSAKAASDGTIWLPARVISADTSSGYDVIDAEGRVLERIHLAKGQRLLGFGKGVVYVAVDAGPRKSIVGRVPLH